MALWFAWKNIQDAISSIDARCLNYLLPWSFFSNKKKLKACFRDLLRILMLCSFVANSVVCSTECLFTVTTLKPFSSVNRLMPFEVICSAVYLVAFNAFEFLLWCTLFDTAGTLIVRFGTQTGIPLFFALHSSIFVI